MDEQYAAQPTETTLERVRSEILRGRGAALLPIYAGVQTHIAKTGVGCAALKAGAPAPAFLLPDHQGHLVGSNELLSKGPLVVRFFRGSWCPFSVAELHIFQAAATAFDALSATVVTLTPDTGMLPRNLKSTEGLDLRILSDVDSGIGLSFGAVFSVPCTARPALKALGADLEARHGNSIWMLPLPATFIIGRNGLVLDAATSLDFTAIARPSLILKRLGALSGD
ncbi:MAG TPA: peroxiredoxin-like family protein [Aliidongia sp.]|nr:peroxiredoxin-like family protein [Aliidongia sp.]